MEFIQPPTKSQIIAKILLDNIIQVMSFLFVLVLLIIRWNSLEISIKFGTISLMAMYFIIRISVAYQSLKFEKEIEKEKKQDKEKIVDI